MLRSVATPPAQFPPQQRSGSILAAQPIEVDHRQTRGPPELRGINASLGTNQSFDEISHKHGHQTSTVNRSAP